LSIKHLSSINLKNYLLYWNYIS